MEIVISDHARFEMSRRGIDETMVTAVAQSPEQVLEAGEGRLIHQSRYHDPAEGKEMLLRVILERRAGHLLLVTAYRTSRVDKYWERGR